MASTKILPASAMQTAAHPDSSVPGVNWTQLSGSASRIAAAPSSTDGSFWVLATQPAGADKYLWHYSGGTWSNIPGLASSLAVGPSGILYALNSGGGIYSWNGSAWQALAGGGSSIAVGADGQVFVTSNSGGFDHAIWRGGAGSWTQMPGTGVALAASFDTGTYVVNGGTIRPGGLYILNFQGAIWYENTDQTFVNIPGSASQAAPTINGGLFVRGYPNVAQGTSIYYLDLSSPSWISLPGQTVSIAADVSHLYAVSTSGAIYMSSTAISFAPSLLNFLATGSAYAQTFTVSEAGYNGSFAIASHCSGTASVAPGSQPNSYVVTPLAVGACSIDATDANGTTATLNVQVTTTTVTGQ